MTTFKIADDLTMGFSIYH